VLVVEPGDGGLAAAGYIRNTGIVVSWGATTASTVTYLIPVVGVVLGVLLLSETLTWNEPAGAVIVILGILTAQNRLAPPAQLIPCRLRQEGRPAALGRQRPVPLLSLARHQADDRRQPPRSASRSARKETGDMRVTGDLTDPPPPAGRADHVSTRPAAGMFRQDVP
jgi:EamA-like transporter family